MKNYRYLMIALLTLGFTACQQEEDFAPQVGEEQEVRISATISNLATRVAYGANGATDFVNGDQILVINAPDGDVLASENRAVYTYNDGEWTPVSSRVMWEKGLANIFYAHYPAIDDADYMFPTDQSTPEKLAAADRMIAVKEEFLGNAVAFKFDHVLTKVTFNTTLAEEFDPSHDKITNFKVITRESIEVTACYNEDDNSYTAIITPFGYKSADDTFVKVYMNQETEPLTVKVPADFVEKEILDGFQPGTHYTFNLKVGKDKVTLTKAPTSDDFPGGWDKEEDLN